MSTLGGFDMMLSITQDALNSSIGALFATPVDRKNPGGDTVISHTLDLGGHEIHEETTGPEEAGTYLSNHLHAEIDQPFVDLRDVDDAPADRGTAGLAVRVLIPVKSGVCTFSHVGTGERRERHIDGMRISYIVKFGRSDAPSAQRETIRPDEPVGMTTAGRPSREPPANSVTALFGPFESTESICRSFRLESWNEERKAYELVGSCGDGLTPLILGCMVDAPIGTPEPPTLSHAVDR